MAARPAKGGASNQPERGKAEPAFSIGELARDLNVTTRTIRFYESMKLLSPERRGTARVYSPRDRARLQLILRGKNLGFSLDEISDYLALYDADPKQVKQTQHLLQKVEDAIGDLEQKRADLNKALHELGDIRIRCQEHLTKTSSVKQH
jgi:DNA-binding transcriptional MerR regulator